MRRYLKQLVCSTGFIVLVAVVVRLFFLRNYLHEFDERIMRDNTQFGAETGAVAASIARGHGFSSPLWSVTTGATAWFAPIYPYILAAVFKIWGVYSYSSDVVIHFINVVFSAATCWPLEAVGTRAFGKKVGIATAWLWVILPNAIYFPVIWVWDTAMVALVMAILVAATLKLRGSTRPAHWMGYGALWAFGGMLNPSLLAVLPFLALWAIWPLRAHLPQAAKLAAASALLFAVGVAPWAIRNYVAFHAFVPFRSNFGLELWLGNNPDVTDTCSCSLHPTVDPGEAARYAKMTEIPYMAEKQHEALVFMRAQPLDAARFVFRRFEDTWLGVWDAPVDVWRYASLRVGVLVVFNCAFSLLALGGALLAFRSNNPAATPLASVILMFPIVFYFTHPSSRYRFPMDTVMLVLAVSAVVHLLSKLAARRSSPVARAIEPLAHGAD